MRRHGFLMCCHGFFVTLVVSTQCFFMALIARTQYLLVALIVRAPYFFCILCTLHVGNHHCDYSNPNSYSSNSCRSGRY